MHGQVRKEKGEMEQRILIADEVAKMLRVDRQRVYELARRNAIPVIRLGERQYRFDAEAIRQWIERGGSVMESETRP
jgi:excisionase family DNA binding protein